MSTELRDIAYAPAEPGGSSGHLLDLYLPDGASGPLPVIVWSGGSGFMRDDGKESATAVAGFFVPKGYAVAGISVRASSQATFPAPLDDAKAAVGWLRAHASEHGLDPDRFASMGNSSGGWVATMLGAAGEVQAAVDLYGPTDFLQMDAHMPDGGAEFKAFMGIDGLHAHAGSPESRLLGSPIETVPDACRAANPITYVGPDTPPMLIVHGQADQFVPHHQSELLFASLRDAGGRAVFYSLPGGRHEHPYVTDPARAAGYVVREARGGEEQVVDDAPPPTWETIEEFIREVLA